MRGITKAALGTYVGGAIYCGSMVAIDRNPNDDTRTHVVGVVCAAVLWPFLFGVAGAATAFDIADETRLPRPIP